MHPFISSFLKIQALQAEDIDRHAIAVEQYWLRELVVDSCWVPELLVGFYYERNIRTLLIFLWDNTSQEFHGVHLRQVPSIDLIRHRRLQNPCKDIRLGETLQ